MLHATSIYLHVHDPEPLLSCSDVTVRQVLNYSYRATFRMNSSYASDFYFSDFWGPKPWGRGSERV